MDTPTQSALRQDNGPTCGFVPLPRWARGPLSVPQDRGTPSCHVKARVVISNYAIKSSRTLGVRLHLTRPTAPNPLPAGDRSGVTTCPGEGSAQDQNGR